MQPEDLGSAKTLPATPIEGGRKSVPPIAVPTPGVDTTHGRAAVAERMEELVDREARARYKSRLHFGVKLATVVWLVFTPLDLLTWYGGARPLWLIELGRFAPLVFFLIMGYDLRRRAEPSRLRMQAYEVIAVGLAMCGSTLIYVAAGGWASPRLPGAALLLMGHAVTLGSHWRQSWVPVMTMTLMLPATLLVASVIDADTGAQLSDGDSMRLFGTYYGIVVAAAAISLFAGHAVWGLRREVQAAKSIGRYRLRRRIATGGMGEVWAAYHEGLGRDVALKLVQGSFGGDSVAVERFEREVRTLAELTHPNIVRVFDYGATEAGVLYYAMELLEADDLHTVVAREGPLEVGRALRLVTQVAEALGEAHARGIVHRDLKPGNLLVVKTPGAREFIKVIDFGIAAQGGEARLTRTGVVVGTPGFIAPETLLGGEATARADVYSLGMVLYVLLTGDHAYSEVTADGLIRAALESEPSAPSGRRPELSEALDALVMRCLARDPLARFEDGAELARTLRGLRDRV